MRGEHTTHTTIVHVLVNDKKERDINRILLGMLIAYDSSIVRSPFGKTKEMKIVKKNLTKKKRKKY